MDTINNPADISENFINLEKVISDKNPKLLKFLPRFILKYLIRIIHQEEVNRTIYRNRDKFGLDFCNATLSEFGAIININGLENIPVIGRFIVAANHPLGGLDGMALMSACGKARQDIVFPVNDFLMYLPGLRPLFIPINKHGTNAENISIIENTFASDMFWCCISLPGFVPVNNQVRSWICPGKKHSFPKPKDINVILYPVILMDVILHFFIILLISVNVWVLKLILKCCIWLMKCINKIIKLLILLLANLFLMNCLIKGLLMMAGLINLRTMYMK